MHSGVAVLSGRSVKYEYYYEDRVVIEKMDDGCIKVISPEAFAALYCKLDYFNAGLKEDCIEYAENDPAQDLFDYPEWYIQAVEDGFIYDTWDDFGEFVDTFYETSEETVLMEPGDVILRNYRGELKPMTRSVFYKYYDTVGGE